MEENAGHINYGRRLIPSLVDEYARTKPDYIFAQIPKGSDFADGLQDITIQTFARAVNEVAHRIDSTIGRSTRFETIAYIGPSDLRYFVIALGASKMGYKTLLPSPRNSIEGLLSLLETTQCQYLLSAPEAKVDHILAKRSMRHFVSKTFEDWVNQEFVPHYEFDKDFESAAHDPFIVIHTSGSTGLPKPVTLYHGGLATVDMHHLMPSFDGYGSQVIPTKAQPPERFFNTLPPFHVAGILGALLIALYYGQTAIWPPAGRPISADIIDNLLENVEVDACFLVPSVLEEMSQSQTSLENLGKLRYVQFAGGPLSQSAGDAVARYTTIRNAIGSSEAALLPIYAKEPEDWIYFKFNPEHKGIEFRDVGNGLYQQVFVRHPSTDPYHSCWYTFPNEQEYTPKDLFSKHPSKPGLWLYEGRSDDVIVFSNGEKFNPKGMEATLKSHPKVNQALVVGQARFQPAALIELKDKTPLTDQARSEVLESLAPHIREANKTAPAYASLHADHVTFTKPEKPILLADKGTMKRAATVKAYEQEIDQLYIDAEDSVAPLLNVKLDTRDPDRLTQSLLDIMIAIFKIDTLKLDEDIFSAGADSLQVMNLVRQLRSSLAGEEGGVSSKLISPRLIYSSPTASKLSKAIRQLSAQGEEVYQQLEEERIDQMKEMLTKYSKDLPEAGPSNTTTDDRLTIIITGSTGSLGSYLVDALLAAKPGVKIICLNRSDHGQEQQIHSNKSRGLTTEWGDQVRFLKTDLSKKNLGLGSEEYDILLKESSFIIHNQWQVDFNLSLESFEPHIAGVRDLIDLSNQSIKKPPILFTSSISALGNWSVNHRKDKVPEHAVHDFTIPSAIGYGESKYVAELLLEAAKDKSGVSAAICRVGQLTGPVVKDGVWNKQEWFPSIVASSKYLGKIPESLPGQDTVPWIPVDTTAKIIIELVLSDIKDDSSSSADPWLKHYNLVNPTFGSWSSLIPAIKNHFSPSAIESVSFADWIKALQATEARTDDVKKNPGIKLLEFYASMVQGEVEAELETGKTVARSPTFKGLEAVGPGWMEIWLKQWDF